MRIGGAGKSLPGAKAVTGTKNSVFDNGQVKDVANQGSNAVSGGNWNVSDTLKEESHTPLSGVQGAFQHTGGDISNAWKTSVNDPLNHGAMAIKGGVTDFAKHLQDMWNNANNGLKVGGPPGMGGGGNPFQISAPTMPQGFGGGMNGFAGPITADDVFRTGQTQLLSQLQAQANGTGQPSIAQNQLKMGQEQALANNIAMANSARGGANPLAARQALQTNAQQAGGMAMDAANLRMQEQQQAQQMLGSLTNQGRAGDLGSAQLSQQGQIAQQDLAAKYAQMGMNAQQANQQAALDMLKMQQDSSLGWGKLGLESQMAQNGLLGGAMQGGAGVLAGLGTMFSDRKLKTKIKNADAELRDFLSKIEPASYEYKNKAHGAGKFISPMAQDLQKSKLGKAMVEKKPEGLAVNYGANLGLILAAQASLHKRLEELETK